MRVTGFQVTAYDPRRTSYCVAAVHIMVLGADHVHGAWRRQFGLGRILPGVESPILVAEEPKEGYIKIVCFASAPDPRKREK